MLVGSKSIGALPPKAVSLKNSSDVIECTILTIEFSPLLFIIPPTPARPINT